MNEKNVKQIMFGIIIIVAIIMLSITFMWIITPNEFIITINSDDNTAELYKSINQVASYEKCLNRRYTQDEQENIADIYVDKVNWCTINNKIIDNCTAIISHWSDNSTAMQIEYISED